MKSKTAEIISRYADQSGDLIAAVEGLTDPDLNRRLEPGKWSVREQVSHLADAEMNVVQRMKKVISEDTPLLPAYDQDKWANNLFYNNSSADDSVALFFTLRTSMTRILKQLKEKDFDRFGIHTEKGKMTLLELLEESVDHAAHHMKMIEKTKKKFKIE